MEYITKNGVTIAVMERSLEVDSVQDILDLIVSASYLGHAVGIILLKESLPASFFDLKTGVAGEILQKFSNYRFKLAIVGDFSAYAAKSLQDFIYECNKGKLIFFKPDTESAVSALIAE